MINFITEYWLGFLFGGITTGFGVFIKYVLGKRKQQEKEQKTIKDGLLAILHDRLYQCCMYHIRKKEIDKDDMKNVEYIYSSYHELGGNGTGTELYNRVKALPLKED